MSTTEILNAEIERDADLQALLLYEDNDIRARRFIGVLPAASEGSRFASS